MKKIKILQFSISNSCGGITQYVLNNWEYIDKSRFQFDFVTLSQVLDKEVDLCAQGCNVYHISCYAEDNMMQFKRELREILKESYDAIHIHTGYWRGFAVEEVAREMGVPKVIIHSHNTGVHKIGMHTEFASDAEQNMAVENHLYYRSLLTADMGTDFWACSKAAANWLFDNRIPKERIKILYNGVDTQKFFFREEIRKQYREEFNIQNCFVIGHVGRFASQKNHIFLIEVMKHVLVNYEHVRLISVGWGELKEMIVAKAMEYGIKDKIIFLERRDDINMLMQAMDLFLLPSLYEGFPIVLAEAQAEGLPCIISNTITDEVCITPAVTRLPLEERAWIEKIDNAIVSKKKVNRRDNIGLLEQTEFNIKNQIKKLECLYSASCK